MHPVWLLLYIHFMKKSNDVRFMVVSKILPFMSVKKETVSYFFYRIWRRSRGVFRKQISWSGNWKLTSKNAEILKIRSKVSWYLSKNCAWNTVNVARLGVMNSIATREGALCADDRIVLYASRFCCKVLCVPSVANDRTVSFLVHFPKAARIS